ncbi:glycosyl hydrolase family 47, partial [Ostertagia ostertagi]
MGDMGATIVDAIDTLWIMGLKEEYEEARSWVKHSLDFKRTAKGDLSVFETNIRFIGGLLSIYALTKDKMYVEKAEEIAKLLLPAFDTPTGIPYAVVNVVTGSAKNYGWASGQSSILSEFGSLQLEFDYLSHVTGNKIYSEKIERIRDFLTNMDKPNGLYPLYLNPKTGKWGS